MSIEEESEPIRNSDAEARALLLAEIVGVRCRKLRSRGKECKPFKSGLKVNTIRGVATNPHTNLPGYTFMEDDSVVNQSSVMLEFECTQCSTLCFDLLGFPFIECENCGRQTLHLPYKASV